MKNLFALLTFASLTAQANPVSFTGPISSNILGQQLLNVSLQTSYGAKGRAESYVGVDHDTRDMYCTQRLNFNAGNIQYSLGPLKSTETLTVSLGSTASIESEDQCLTTTYSARDIQSQWVNGSNSTLVLNVRKSGNNTITTKLTLQFNMPFVTVNGDLVRLHDGDDYQLSQISAQLNNSTYITYQIVEHTQGDIISWSTLEQGRIDLNQK
jgi:hypothetical protein